MNRALSTIARCMTFSACMVLLACAHTPRSATPPSFTGRWSVKWCDREDPSQECGGFSVDLAQTGDRIEGESYGARVGLAQVDEGGVIRGIAEGNTAVLTVESLRSGAIYLVRASVEGDCLRWKMRDTVRRPERDIDIVAFDEVLVRRSSHAAAANDGEAASAACARLRQDQQR